MAANLTTAGRKLEVSNIALIDRYTAAAQGTAIFELNNNTDGQDWISVNNCYVQQFNSNSNARILLSQSSSDYTPEVLALQFRDSNFISPNTTGILIDLKQSGASETELLLTDNIFYATTSNNIGSSIFGAIVVTVVNPQVLYGILSSNYFTFDGSYTSGGYYMIAELGLGGAPTAFISNRSTSVGTDLTVGPGPEIVVTTAGFVDLIGNQPLVPLRLFNRS
jgi:hypothetical protein